MGEQPRAGALDVLAGEAGSAHGVAGCDGVEDALVLACDIPRGDQLMGLHLPDAEFDLAHEEGMHPGQAGARLARDQLAVEGNVLLGE